VQDETDQHLSRIGEELWATTSEVQRPDLPGQGEGARPRSSQAGLGADFPSAGANPRGDSERRPAHRETGEEVPGRGTSLATQRGRSAHRSGLPADVGGQEPVQVQSNGRCTPRTAPQKEAIWRRRSSVANYQGGESFLEKAAGVVRELHLGALREGQRLETLGNGADEARWKEREETGTGGSGAKAWSFDAPPLGDRRGLRA